MAYDLNDLKGGFRERPEGNMLPADQISAMNINDRNLQIINENFNPLKNLGFELNDDGTVPVKDGVPRIFMLQPDESGMDRIKTLDEAGIKTGTREFWHQVQMGNVYAYPTGSEDPVQIQANIKPGSAPRPAFSAPLDMEKVHQLPSDHVYRKPGFFARMINRIFPNYRKRDMEIYREREKFTTMAEKRAKGMSAEQEELKEAEKNAAVKAEKKKLKNEYERLAKETGYKAKGKQFYKDLVAPTPKYYSEESRSEGNEKGFYSREEFDCLKIINKDPESYVVGKEKLSADEYSGLVLACSYDRKFAEEGFKNDSNHDETLVDTLKNAGYSEDQAKDIIIGSYETMIADDVMKGDLRVNQGVQIKPTIAPARDLAFEILDEYKQGKKDRLAEKIADNVKHAAAVTDSYVRTPHNGAFNHFEFAAATADLLERDPDLKKLAFEKGMKQEDLDAVRGMREYSKLDSARGKAKTALAKATAEGGDLSYQDKLKYAKDIITANIMEEKLLGENREKELKGKAFNKETDRLKEDAEKNGLVVTEAMKGEWAANPGSRPLPPKGKFFTDQIVTMMSGRTAEFNEHPDAVFEFNDKEAMTDCRLIAEDIVESKGLADLSAADLNKALNGPGNMYQGFKLVEQADKAAEKIAEQRRREELGIEEPKAQTELDKSFDLGDKGQKKPEAGVPVA